VTRTAMVNLWPAGGWPQQTIARCDLAMLEPDRFP
jgi:hypothetical protein